MSFTKEDYIARGVPVPSVLLASECVARIQDLDLRRLCEHTISTRTPDIVNCVKAFHLLYGMPIVRPDKAREDFSHIDKPRLAMRAKLIAEEFKEWCAAMDIKASITYEYQDEEGDWVVAESFEDAIENTEERDMGKVADACEDLKYVITGFELEVGIDPHAVLHEVQCSNMSKMGADGNPIRRADGKILKGPFYFEPNARRALSILGLKFGPEPPALTTDGLDTD